MYLNLLCSRMHCCHCLWIKKNAATPLSPWKVGEFFPIFNSQKKKKNDKKKGSFFLKKSQFDKPPQNKQLYHFRSARSARTNKCREVLDRKKNWKIKNSLYMKNNYEKREKVCAFLRKLSRICMHVQCTMNKILTILVLFWLLFQNLFHTLLYKYTMWMYSHIDGHF